MEEQIVLQNVTKTFKDFWGKPRVTAVKSLSFSIKKGEIFGLLGPNGSGKSTTLKLILGLLYPNRGRIAVLGRLPGDSMVKRIISYLPEQDYLYPYLDARETLDFYGKIFNLSGKERRQRIDLLIDLLGMQGYQHRAVGEYSKGMSRRIGFAQALINDPDLLILDEPTSGMDPIGNKEMKDIFLDLKSKGKTILVSSHLLSDIETTCDRIGIIYQGSLIGIGEVDELLASYRQESHPLENFFIDTVQKEKERQDAERRAARESEVLPENPEEVDRKVLDKLTRKK
jgi:ABC-2 type transport system ATP-binding protein